MHAQLSEREIERSRRLGAPRKYPAGEFLFEAGQVCAGMLIVLNGTVRINYRDGLGRSLNEMVLQPGQFIAEVGQLSGKPAMVDACAIEDVEALLLAPHQLRQLIVSEAELGERVMRSLILRRSRLVEMGAGPVIVGGESDREVVALQHFFARNDYPHRTADPQCDPHARRVLKQAGISAAELPVVLCLDGSVLRRPDPAEISSQLGWCPSFRSGHIYDVTIVGAGPAGLATAVYAASEGLSVLVLDGRAPGGQAGESSRIENYLGFATGVSGSALARCAFLQAQKFGAQMAIPVAVESLECDDFPIRLKLTDGQRVRTHTLVIATGASYRRAEKNGLDELNGRGAHYWVSPAGAKLSEGMEVAVIGGGNSAGQGAACLAMHAARVHLLFRRSGLESTMSRYLIDRLSDAPNVALHAQVEVQSARVADGTLSGLLCATPRGAMTLGVRHAFIFTGAAPNTQWLKGSGVRTDDKGFVVTGAAAGHPGPFSGSLETSIPGVFAIGDVRSGSVKRVAAAVGEGAGVVAQIHGVIERRRDPVRSVAREASVAATCVYE
ncbi:FAD-dependent oxidoreductase [Paraburkholderia sp. RAU2J]|uniref:FAD-dependent oxidoreductase n=1 Tax=Paraburkholderia sp. RAU2J TaxID=1938810 RepID=UPI0013159D1F|nr:FAD-dependent oxidoreductase [Paraburkholderia sp. RAU2J]